MAPPWNSVSAAMMSVIGVSVLNFCLASVPFHCWWEHGGKTNETVADAAGGPAIVVEYLGFAPEQFCDEVQHNAPIPFEYVEMVRRILRAAYHAPHTMRRVLRAAYYAPRTTRCALLTTHYAPSEHHTTYHSLLTTHYSLLTPHYLPRARCAPSYIPPTPHQVCILLFSLEFALRVAACPAGPGLLAFFTGLPNVIDIVAIVPWYIEIVIARFAGEGTSLSFLSVRSMSCVRRALHV